jgi:hypothetical protein
VRVRRSASARSCFRSSARPTPARQIWITETALATALNGSDLAEQLANFGIVVGIALLLAGVGFVVLAVGGALRRTDVTRLSSAPPGV